MKKTIAGILAGMALLVLFPFIVVGFCAATVACGLIAGWETAKAFGEWLTDEA